jgi:ABC-type dipeptide/oligopeptide/nickel transport system permease component
VLVEVVFSWPGLGYYAVNSILNTDYAPVQGFVLLTATIYVLVNLVVDLLYTAIDPRITY